MALFPAYGVHAGIYRSGPAELWTPKTQKLNVGRELAPLSATAFNPTSHTITVGKGSDARFTSTEVYGLAKSLAMGGSQVKNYRMVDAGKIVFSPATPDGTSPLSDKENIRQRNLAEVRATDALMETTDRLVTRANGMVQVWRKEEDGELSLMAEERLTGDTRITWDSDNNPKILSGGQALTNGVLAAHSDNEILIRLSDAAVAAGNNSTVLNLSAEAGDFSGGHNVTYLGAYTGSAITGGTGETTYAGFFAGATLAAGQSKGIFSGVFEGTQVTGGDAADVFSGYFSGGTVQGGKGANEFRGMFLAHAVLSGGDDADNFTGQFIDSSIDGAEGDNTFGTAVNINAARTLTDQKGWSYSALTPDFVNTDILSGSGKDVFQGVAEGGTVSLGDGNNRASGIYTETRITTGSGNDSVIALYANTATIQTGDGDDTVNLATAFSNTVATGQGINTVTLGQSGEGSVGLDLSATFWRTAAEARNQSGGSQHGDNRDNKVEDDGNVLVLTAPTPPPAPKPSSGGISRITLRSTGTGLYEWIDGLA